MVGERGQGTPLTDEERAAHHESEYGSEPLPERGTGLTKGSARGSNPGKEPLDILVTTDATGSTYDYIESDPVPPGEMWCLEHYAFENQTGARGTVRLYKGNKTLPYFLKEHEAPLQNELVFEDAPIYLRERQRLGFRQATCTSGDDLVLYATGYRIHGKYRD